MDIRTENLTIVFVDIAGFTATTSRQSRAENAKLLQTFNSTLLPLIKRFKGRVIKSIGDALLITFRSPTDAMLCAMALQDAMHAHNLRASDDDKIHIRVAANLGEVRITKNDIFGEPVNVASRIEGVTPADEIYLSEAVYMAMNKAEVPAQEAGLFELAGVSGALRLYCIPRFATPRLIPQQMLPQEQGSELLFPYGGMHQRAPEAKHGQLTATGAALKWIAVAALVAVAVGGVYWWQGMRAPPVSTDNTLTQTNTAATPTPVVVTPMAEKKEPVIEAAKELPPIVSVDAQKSVKENKKDVGVPASSAPTKSETQEKPVPTAVSKTIANTEPAAEKVVAKPVSKPIEKTAPVPIVSTPPAIPQGEDFSLNSSWNVAKLKRAYKAGAITKPQYRTIADKLEEELDAKVRELKLAYRAKKISEDQYEQGVREAKRAYAGR